MARIKKNIDLSLPQGTKVPNHVVIIPDGNRRWARARGLTAIEGHRAGTKNMIQLLEAARKWGIHTATAWGLSTENWIERPENEVKFLMKLISRELGMYFQEAMENDVKVIHLGRKDRLPKVLLNKLAEIEEKTQDNKSHILNLALDYNGQDELERAVKRMLEDKVNPSKINAKLIDSYMDTSGQPYPYPDLIIRTSGEQRTSGVLAWQSIYAEMYFEPLNFPAFTPNKLKEAILDYSRRRRRFGGNDEVKQFKFTPELAAKFEVAWWRLSKIPEGTKFSEYTVMHLKEQYGLSKNHASMAAKYMIEAITERKRSKWGKAKKHLVGFYEIIKEEVKLAFEPSIVANLEVKFWKDIESDSIPRGEVEESARQLYAEVYRISAFQAANLAHLRVMAAYERKMAEAGFGDYHWDNAEDYLEKFYSALKDKVA